MLISVFVVIISHCVYMSISKGNIVHIKCLQFCKLYFNKAGWAGGGKKMQFQSLPVYQ